MNNFKSQLEEKVKFIEKIIYGYCPKNEGLQKIIMEAMEYSVKAGGKRLRPMLVLESLKLFGGDEKEAYPFMAAIEMIHTYSLVHDDLPAMDNDEYRRGMKTTHAQYGEDIAILAGDALLNYAYEIMIDATMKSSNVENALRAMHIISTKAGIYGMVGGQTVDVINEGKEKSIDTINFIHKLKTAALIEASLMAGAALAGATKEQIEMIEQIGRKVGIAFQIQDDILDVTSSMEVLGKPVLSDEKNNKITYVTLMGIEKSKQLVDSYSNDAIKMLQELNCNNEFLKELFIVLINREK